MTFGGRERPWVHAAIQGGQAVSIKTAEIGFAAMDYKMSIDPGYSRVGQMMFPPFRQSNLAYRWCGSFGKSVIIKATMREIPERFKDSAVGKALREAQETFLKASQELLTANRAARAGNYADTNEVRDKAGALLEAEERMKAAEATFDLVTGGPEPIPLTDAVRRKVLQSFPAEQRAEVIRVLERECANNLPFSDIGTPEGLERIRLAVLKVANGNQAEFRKQIDAAKTDWRDVINAAEYPEATQLGLLEYGQLDNQTREQIDKRDLEQYLAWLGPVERPTKRRNIWRKLWHWKRNR